jgi:crotonobetainyl-CoA:carnitine CoA-transferase CaiB-like acyl-CoA transferase
MAGPLEDVIVLDLTQQLAGPGGTMLPGDTGAVVIRADVVCQNYRPGIAEKLGA